MRCAADASAYWQVNSRRLGEMTERILGLWREGDEALQVPDTQDNRSVIVTQAEARDDLSLFVTLDGDHDIRTAEIAVYEEANRLSLNRGQGSQDPFALIKVPAGPDLRLVATETTGAFIGEETLRAYPPAAFRKLPPDQILTPLVRPERAKGIRRGSASLELNRNSKSIDTALIR